MRLVREGVEDRNGERGKGTGGRGEVKSEGMVRTEGTGASGGEAGGNARVYAVVAGRTGGGDGVVGAHEADVHRQHRCIHVGDGERDAEGVHLPVACRRRG